MISELRARLLDRSRDQRGVTLVEAVLAMVLFFAIGGTFVYATMAVESARKNSLAQTKSTISESGVSNSFRADLKGAKGLRINADGTYLSVAKADDSCVNWRLSTNGSSTGTLTRGFAQGSAVPTTNQGSVLADGISSGKMAIGTTSSSITLNFASGRTFSESAPLEIAGSDGGVCW